MRSPIAVSVATQAPSAWMPLDYTQRPFDVGLFVSADQAATTATFGYTVEHTPDNVNDMKDVVSITRSGTAATLTASKAHGLVAGDNIVVQNSGDLNLDGSQIVASVPSPTTLTYTVANTGATKDGGQAKASYNRVFPDATLATKTAKGFVGLTVPVYATRINATSLSAGVLTLEAVQGYGRG